MKLLLLSMLINGINSLINNIPTKTYTRDFDNAGQLKIIEPFECDKEDTPSLIFFSGGRGLIPNEIYTSLINYIASNKISCCVYNGNFENINKVVDILDGEYSNITALGHSSGGYRALKLMETNNNVKNGILLDPVDDRLLFDNKMEYLLKNEEDKKIRLKNKNNLLFIRAKKAYEWSLFPPNAPFIPFFDIKPEDVIIDNDQMINKSYDEEYIVENHQPIIIRNHKNFRLESNKQMIDIEKFGHCDILDKYWSDIAHETISKGYEDRNSDMIDLYHRFNSYLIKELCYNNLEDLENNLKNIENLEKINYNIQKY